jgi:hypothetical protein
MTTAIPVPVTATTPPGSKARARQDLDSELREIQNSSPPIQKLKPYVRPLGVKLRLGWARIWKNKGLYAGMTCFTTAAAQFGWVPGLIVAGVACIVGEALT